MDKNILSRIFIFNALESDIVNINGRKVTKNSSEKCRTFDGLQTCFIGSSYAEAVAQGMTNSINPVAINADDVRGADQAVILPIYYLRNKVTLSID